MFSPIRPISAERVCSTDVRPSRPAPTGSGRRARRPDPVGAGRGGRTSVEQTRSALIGRIGENMSIRRFQRFETTSKVTSYLHGTRIGVMVEVEGAEEQVGK